MTVARLFRSICLPLLLVAGTAAHADIYGYVDEYKNKVPLSGPKSISCTL